MLRNIRAFENIRAEFPVEIRTNSELDLVDFLRLTRNIRVLEISELNFRLESVPLLILDLANFPEVDSEYPVGEPEYPGP